MVSYAAEIFIDRPPEQVFPYLIDASHHGDWMDVAGTHAVDGGPTGIGSKVAGRMVRGPMRMDIEYEVSELDPNRRVVYRSTKGPMLWASTFAVEPEGTGSRVASSGTVQFQGFLRLLQPLLSGEVQGGEEKELRRLKALLEGSEARTT